MQDITSFLTDTKRIKYNVLKEVASLAFSDRLEEEKDNIPYNIINTTSPSFRCCVYKEREIIRGRVRLAMGKTSMHQDKSDVVIDVIQAACEGCPINRFSITENCQKCMAKKCIKTCPFNAITMTGRGAYIDQDKCRECGRCVSVCPYNAIADLMRPCKRNCPVDAITMDENKIAVIQRDKCINCGACTVECPFGAVSDISQIVDVIDALKSKKTLYAITAPAIEGQFGDGVSFGILRHALIDIGFEDVLEVALGADAVSQHESSELKQAISQSGKLTTSCCPAFVNLINKHFPGIADNMSNTVSPMLATSRYIKAKSPNASVVFIGPCIAKKGEANQNREGDVDYVLTTEELLAMLDAKDVDFSKYNDNEQYGSIYGKQFAQSGGVTAAVLRVLEEEGTPVNVCPKKCDGAAECKKALTLLSVGKLPENFLEGMSCVGGCVNGPANVIPANKAKVNRGKLIAAAQNIDIKENLKKHNFSNIKMEI